MFRARYIYDSLWFHHKTGSIKPLSGRVSPGWQCVSDKMFWPDISLHRAPQNEARSCYSWVVDVIPAYYTHIKICLILKLYTFLSLFCERAKITKVCRVPNDEFFLQCFPLYYQNITIKIMMLILRTLFARVK